MGPQIKEQCWPSQPHCVVSPAGGLNSRAGRQTGHLAAGLNFSNERLSSQYSRSEVVLTFFERSPLDQVLKNDNVHKIQPSFQSPVKISGERDGQV